MKFSRYLLSLFELAVPVFMFGASPNGPMINNSNINYFNNQITIVGQNFGHDFRTVCKLWPNSGRGTVADGHFTGYLSSDGDKSRNSKRARSFDVAYGRNRYRKVLWDLLG
jgi:hypothetical protein